MHVVPDERGYLIRVGVVLTLAPSLVVVRPTGDQRDQAEDEGGGLLGLRRAEARRRGSAEEGKSAAVQLGPVRGAGDQQTRGPGPAEGDGYLYHHVYQVRCTEPNAMY